ncbi:F-box protein SKIP27 [Carex littledalei]|uniref:F-box protein SKIP27 n=1 Tax=Carex littledalei TaxID=544730 RepID=A0A833VER0_9POAL|nr:F-box protein SKIP27 [Carex littledalei]
MAIGHIDQEKSFQLVQNTRILGRKRIVVTQDSFNCSGLFSPVTYPQKRRSRRPQIEKFNMLESLPKDMLVKVLCKVDSSDLGQLLVVSKTVSEAALIARKIHHLYSTPTKRTFKWLDISDNYEDAPNAPMQHRVARSRNEGKNLASLAVDLFLNYDD